MTAPLWIDVNGRPDRAPVVVDGPVWWKKEEPEGDPTTYERARADSLVNCARRLENVQREVHEQNLWNAQLYCNRELAAFDWGTGALYRASLAPLQKVGENVVLTVVDSLVSQVGKNRPKATPVCLGASWKLRLAAKRLDKFLYGEFMRNQVFELGKRVFRDATIFGFGCLHVTVEQDKQVGARTRIERVFPDELLLDQAEYVALGHARHIYRRRVMPAEVVSATWNIPLEELIASGSGSESYLPYRDVGHGWITVVEGWQRGGRHVVAIPGRILKDEPYPHEWLPFVFFHWMDEVSGFYRPGAVEQALEYQIRLNEINEVIRDAQDLMARPRIFVQEGTRINPLELDNRVGRIIKYAGTLPEPQTWPAASAELYNERDRCWSQCLAQFGLNQMTAQGQAPTQSTRFDSSKAFREFNQILDGRLADVAQRYERLYMDLAECMVRVIRASGANPRTTWYSGGRRSRAETIQWDDIDLEDEAYVMTLQPSSVYNMTPAAQKDELMAQLARGEITPEQYRLECVHPDLESEATLGAAAAADIRRVIDLLENDKFEYPDRAQDLVQGVQLVTLAYLNLKQYEDVPTSTFLNFLDWLTAARSILESGTAEAEPPPGALPPEQTTPEMAPMGFSSPAPAPVPGMM